MDVSRETLDALKRMGLTDYETRTYLAINSIITGTAAEISQVAGVPRPKVYPVLKSLAKKEFIEMGTGKPIKFTVISPHEIFERNRSELRRSMDRAEAELNMVYENQIPQVPAPIWMVHGPDKIVNKELEIIARTEESLFIMGGLMFPGEPARLKKQLETASRRGVMSRIMTAPVCHVDGVEVPTMEIMEGLPAEIKFFPVPYIKLLVRDKQEMLIAFCKLSGKDALSETAIGIWNQYEEFVETIHGIYGFIWNSDFFQRPGPATK